ncbi:rhomboid family intramembrane serine protease [Sphingobacterium humi]|uniref:Rhomboid family intramembrane serine protease n=1 Tax=Sphingobacterium humi TaxID=1796905 RepID=A0A6N8KYM2_9SPHI|nr:rhomboid family intramembrane serine protease [Sphingobacterium humi]MVZ61819.1 rhomboid family intramembrane serine protease [Sphingobacterium humi]
MLLNYLLNLPVASVIFALTIGLSIYVFSNPQWYGRLMLHPYSVYRDKSKWYLVLTSGLIHKDWMHLLFNMITFYYFGFGLEATFVQISGPLGHLWFALLYIVALVLSDIATIIQNKDNYGYHSLGASGAISAVLFSYILFDPKMLLGIFMIIPMPAYIFAVLYLGYCIWASKNASDGINHDAHLFGALTGILFTLILYPWIFKHFVSQF